MPIVLNAPGAVILTWRLFASVVAVTDSGDIAMSNERTDWPSERSCMTAIQQIYSPPVPATQSIGGHKVTIKVSAMCMPVVP
jgi:hypothetical protein